LLKIVRPYICFVIKSWGELDMLEEIPLTWKPIRNRSFAGMLGQQELAYVLQHDGQTSWKWMVSGCNGTIRYDFQSAETLDEAKAAVQASIEEWFRVAGLLNKAAS
jgi:hypothetical protein